jgi:hypothetical protein
MENIAKALIKVQGELKAVPKDGKGVYGKYQTLDDILNVTRPILTANKLALVQQVATATHENSVALKTMLIHESGEYLSEVAEMPIPGGRANEAQRVGQAVTYLRRYTLGPLLGIVSEDDNDGDISQPTQAKQPAKKKAPVKPTDAARKAYHATGTNLHGKDWDKVRKQQCEYYGVESSNDFTAGQMATLTKGMSERLAEKSAEAHNVALFEAEGAYAE